jgi:hypothetical protein
MKVISRSLEETELLVESERATLRRDFELWRSGTRERVVSSVASPAGIGAALLVGYLLGGLFQRRAPLPSRRGPQPVIQPETKRQGAAAVLGGLLVSALRWRYGSPWAAVPVWVNWAQARRRKMAAQARPVPGRPPGGPPATPRPPAWQRSR